MTQESIDVLEDEMAVEVAEDVEQRLAKARERFDDATVVLMRAQERHELATYGLKSAQRSADSALQHYRTLLHLREYDARNKGAE